MILKQLNIHYLYHQSKNYMLIAELIHLLRQIKMDLLNQM